MRTTIIIIAALVSGGAIADEKRLEACRAKLIQAQKLDVLRDLQWKGPTAHVVAGPTYYQMPFDNKEVFAETVNCFMMAGGPGCLSFDIKHWQTGRAQERFYMCKLKPI